MASWPECGRVASTSGPQPSRRVSAPAWRRCTPLTAAITLRDPLQVVPTPLPHQHLRGPVAARPDPAAAGKLFTFLAGKPEPVERSRPVISAYADRIIPMGEDPAVAMSMKLAGNFMVASIIELIGQVYVFAEKRGVDPAIVTGMFKQFMPATSEYVDRISSRNFGNAGFTLDGGLKDIQLILAAV